MVIVLLRAKTLSRLCSGRPRNDIKIDLDKSIQTPAQKFPHKRRGWLMDMQEKDQNDALGDRAQPWLKSELTNLKTDTGRADLAWEQSTTPTKELYSHTIDTGLNPHSQIDAAINLKEIARRIKSYGLNMIADRILYLHKVIDNSPDQINFDLASLRNLALFFINEPQLPTPQIVVDEEGLSHAEWQIQDRGILIMVFLPSDMIKFVGICQPHEHSQLEWDVSGTLPPKQMLKAIKPFLDMRLTN